MGRGAPGKAEMQADVGRGEVADSISERDTKNGAAAESPGGKTDGDNVLEGVVKETTIGPCQVHWIPVSRVLTQPIRTLILSKCPPHPAGSFQ